MELLQLTYFISAARAQSFTAAAKQYGVPTSDISQTVKRLERELGTELFVRSANRVALSAEGRMFLESAVRVTDELENAKRRIRDSLETVSGEIRLQVLTNRRVVTEAIERYHALYPQVELVLSHTAGGSDSFDIVISDIPPAASGYEKRHLITERFLLAVSKDSSYISDKDKAYDSAGKIRLSELSNVPFITMPEHSSHYRMTVEICRRGGFVPVTGIKCDDPYYLRKYVEMGLGAAFVPEFSWKGLISEDIRLFDVTDITRTTNLYLSSFGSSGRAVGEFVPILEKACGKKQTISGN